MPIPAHFNFGFAFKYAAPVILTVVGLVLFVVLARRLSDDSISESTNIIIMGAAFICVMEGALIWLPNCFEPGSGKQHDAELFCRLLVWFGVLLVIIGLATSRLLA